VNSSTIDIQHLPLTVQAAYVALFRLRAALAAPPNVVYQIEPGGNELAESAAAEFVSALPTPVALNGSLEGTTFRLTANTASEDNSPRIQSILRSRETAETRGQPEWAAPARYGDDRGSRPVGLQAQGQTLLARAAAVELSIGEYWLGCPYSMGISFDDSDGPLAERARELGAIACFTLGPPPRLIAQWII
jgi:hypothetical protein